jgi:hypothetical protein
VRRAASRVLLASAVGLTALRLAHDARNTRFDHTDFHLFFAAAQRSLEGGAVYLTRDPDLFRPGSPTGYKWPPPVAAALVPFAHRPIEQVIPLFFGLAVACLGGSLVLLLATLKPALRRALLIVLAFLNWQPFYETLYGLQLEPLLLLLLSAWIALLRAGRLGWASVPLGAGAALKLYPGLLLLVPALRRRWRSLAAGLLAAAVTLLAAGLTLPLRLSFEYFAEVLPRLGGTSLSIDNVSAMAHLGRVAILQSDVDRPWVLIADEAQLETACGAFACAAAAAAWAVLCGLLVAIGVRAYRRGSALPAAVREPAMGGLSLCLLLFLIPTSWLDYQTLLVLPLAWALAAAPGGARRDPVTWTLLGAAAVLGAMPAGGWFYESHLAAFSLARSALPLLLFWAHARLLDPQVWRRSLRALGGAPEAF